ncbi:tape measure protein [Pseudomonas sp.]|uniref:tape measure protein n=1 Tax=Pseudomonas sp. TaxID=306 RepID=UPI00264832BB|nr:tape measure protein [Pseudomonas sp.]MDN5518505.1 tape measure protein [Pseudomonas sp.]MDN5531547.1 tape measure protein [Pseudomonas sp.]
MAQESRLSIVIDSRNARQQIDQLRTSLNSLGDAGGEATVNVRGLGTAARAAGSALAALGVGAVAREVLRMTDAFKNMQGSLALVSTSTANASESFQKLLAMANNTGSSLESTVSLYTRLANATRGAGYTQEQMLNVTDALNKAFVISGATMQEASNAAIQLSQGLASGTLRGEELNSVMEQGPRITRALADYLGVTNGEIRKLAAEGKITGDVVTNALLKSLTSLNAELAKMPRTFEQASQALKNNFLAAIGQINVDPVVSSVDALAKSLAQPEVVMGIQNIANALGSLVAVGGDGLKTVAENTDALMAITGAYATRVGTGLVVSLAAATKARYADLVATQQQVVAEKQAEVASTAAAAQAARKAVADETAAVAATQRSLAETAAARAAQANTIAQLQAVQQQLAADRALETQRLQAQINDVGRQQSLTRLGEIRRAEAAITLQQAAAERALSQAAGQEVIIQGQLAAGQARLTALREADTVAVAAQNAAQVSLNTSQSLGARASAGLMALAGGPIGLVTTALTLAAGAAIYFASSTDSATQSLIDQNLTLDDSIVKYRQLSAEQQRFQSAKWMEAQRDAAKDASSALSEYFTRAFDGLNSLGASGVESAGTFKRMFEEVRNGQRSLDSLTAWLTSNTQISSVYRDELVRIGAEYSSSSQKADDYARLLDRSKTATDGATSSAKSLASAHQASAAAVGGGEQAWEKYISQLTQTRDLIGANTAQEAAYTAAKAGFNSQQVEYARLIGEQTDLLKKYEEAVKDGKKEDQERLRVQLTASITASEAIKTQMESQGRSMKTMAENAESSAKRQVDAIQTVIDQTVRYAKGLSLVEKYEPKQNLQGASLLTFGQQQPTTQSKSSPKTKTVAEMVQEVLDQIDGNTTAKTGNTGSPKGQKGLSSKLNEAQTAFDNLYKAAQPAKFALQEYVERQSQLELLLAKGKITQQQYNEALAQSSTNYAAAIKGAKGLTQAEQYRAQLERQLQTDREENRVNAAAVGTGDLQAERARSQIQLVRDTNTTIQNLMTERDRTESEREKQALQRQIDLQREYLPQRIAEMQNGWAQMDQAMLNPINGWTAAVQNFGNQARDIAGQTESIFSSAFNNISTDITDAIMDGQLSFSTLGDIASNVVRDIIAGFVKMGVQMALNAALNATLGTAAAGQSMILAGTTATAWAPAAAMASLATLGANSVPAAAALTSTTALASSLAVIPGFATGGYVSGAGTGTSDSIMARLSDGEFVVNAAATKRNRALLEAINSNERVSVAGGGSVVSTQSSGGSQAPVTAQTNVTVNLIEDRSRAGTVDQRTGDDGQVQIDAFVADIWGGGERAQAIEAAYGLSRNAT